MGKKHRLETGGNGRTGGWCAADAETCRRRRCGHHSSLSLKTGLVLLVEPLFCNPTQDSQSFLLLGRVLGVARRVFRKPLNFCSPKSTIMLCQLRLCCQVGQHILQPIYCDVIPSQTIFIAAQSRTFSDSFQIEIGIESILRGTSTTLIDPQSAWRRTRLIPRSCSPRLSNRQTSPPDQRRPRRPGHQKHPRPTAQRKKSPSMPRRSARLLSGGSWRACGTLMR